MTLLLTGLRIIDGRGGEPLEDGAIAIEGERLSYVGPARGAPPSGTAIDATGHTALPGLINCHTHLLMDERDVSRPRRPHPNGETAGLLESVARARRALENGITTLRDCNAPGTATFELRRAFDAGILPGPRLVLSGMAICATGGHMHTFSYEADGPDAVRRGAREQIKAGADFIKLVAEASSSGGAFERPSVQLSTAEMAAGVDAAHRLGRQATAHALTRQGIAEALAAGVDCIEHGYDTSDELLSRMRDSGTWLVPTISVHDSIVRLGHEVGWGPERRSNSERIREMALDTARRARAAGVRVACGSDAGSPLNPVWEIARELELLVEAGWTHGEAIVAATRAAAELIGAADRLGTLEPGKLADAAIVKGDPLADVGALRRVRAVIRGGVVVLDRIQEKEKPS